MATKKVEMDLRLPIDVAEKINAIAKLAGVKVDVVANVALATWLVSNKLSEKSHETDR